MNWTWKSEMRMPNDRMMLKCGHHPVCLDGVHPACEFIHHQEDNTEEEEEDDKFSKRWYLVVIALLYIGRYTSKQVFYSNNVWKVW